MHRSSSTFPTRMFVAHPKRRRTGVIGVVLLAIAVAGCGSSGHKSNGETGQAGAGQTSTGQQPASRGGTLRFAVNQEPLTLDPNRTTENGSGWTVYSLFDQLVEYMPGSS